LGQRSKNVHRELLRWPEFTFPPPHPSQKDAGVPSSSSYDQSVLAASALLELRRCTWVCSTSAVLEYEYTQTKTHDNAEEEGGEEEQN